jgi:predicted enzyme related to lactoylglutathione lyase
VVATHHDTDVDTGAPLVMLVSPSTSYDIHAIFDVSATKPVKIELYETKTTDITDNGTVFTHCRMNRESTVGDTDRAVTFYGPTVADTGTLLFEMHSGGSTAAQAQQTPVGGGARSGEEFIFSGKTNSYLLYVKPDLSNTQVSIKHEYYEVTPD